MDWSWTTEQIALRRQAHDVAADGVARFSRSNDSWINGYSKEFAKELSALGWIGMTWPAEHGGGGRHPIDRLIVGEELIMAGAPIASMWFADRQMGPTLIAYGRDDQHAEFLPGILAGDTTWCIGMSEPNAGSDLAALKTTARDDGDEWVLNGQKIWTSFAARRRLLLRDLSHVVGRAAARGNQRDHRADADAWHRCAPDHRHDHEPPLLRGVLRGGAGAEDQPRRHGGQRLPPDDAPTRARARRHRPPRVEPRALPGRARARP
ncbi:MAG: acyl-CoA dehydrogenase family protein [Ilumatobacteraceae bacterium]